MLMESPISRHSYTGDVPTPARRLAAYARNGAGRRACTETQYTPHTAWYRNDGMM